MNKFLKIGFVSIVILALILIPTYCCFNQPKQPQSQNNTQQYISETTDNILLNEIAKDKRILEVKYDSLLKVKLRFIKGKDRVRDSLVYVSDSDCQKSINILYYECHKVDSVNNSLISNLQERGKKDSSTISVLNHKIKVKQERINRDSTRVVQLTDTLPKVKRKGFVKGFLIGFGSGAAVDKGVEILSKIKP